MKAVLILAIRTGSKSPRERGLEEEGDLGGGGTRTGLKLYRKRHQQNLQQGPQKDPASRRNLRERAGI